LKNIKKTINSYLTGSPTAFREFIEMISDEVIYIEYNQDTLEEIINYLLSQHYDLDDNIWTESDQFEHILVDFKIKKVTMIKDKWLQIVKELEYPIYNNTNFIVILKFQEE
jgi:hypothetical protein